MTQPSIAKLEMIEGYRDGLEDDRAHLPIYNNFSDAYSHGWLNGRDDRRNEPRTTAAIMREQAAFILSADKREFN